MEETFVAQGEEETEWGQDRRKLTGILQKTCSTWQHPYSISR